MTIISIPEAVVRFWVCELPCDSEEALTVVVALLFLPDEDNAVVFECSAPESAVIVVV